MEQTKLLNRSSPRTPTFSCLHFRYLFLEHAHNEQTKLYREYYSWHSTSTLSIDPLRLRHFPVEIHSNGCYVAILVNNPELHARRRRRDLREKRFKPGYVDTLRSSHCKERYASKTKLANGIDPYETTQKEWVDNIDLCPADHVRARMHVYDSVSKSL